MVPLWLSGISGMIVVIIYHRNRMSNGRMIPALNGGVKMANLTKYRNMGLRRMGDNPIQRLFHDTFDWPGWDPQDVDWMPSADIDETDKNYIVHIDLPGMEKKDVEISVKGDTMTVCGDRKSEFDTDDGKIHRYEREEGHFCRTFNLPENVDMNKITATSKDGVLRIEIPKTSQPKTEEIKINVK